MSASNQFVSESWPNLILLVGSKNDLGYSDIWKIQNWSKNKKNGLTNPFIQFMVFCAFWVLWGHFFILSPILDLLYIIFMGQNYEKKWFEAPFLDLKLIFRLLQLLTVKPWL